MSRWTLPLAAIAGILLGAVGMFWWQSAPGYPGRTRTERVVREYVLAHPELITEAMQRLRDRETGRVVRANREAIVVPYGSAWAGNPQGDVTVVEYFDYNCTYCRASLPVIAALIRADPKVKVVFRRLPVLAPSSRTAAQASLAAAAQGKFAAFHDALYAAGPVTEASIAATARRTGVDLARPVPFDAEVGRNFEVASKLGFTGTPSWVIGDRVLSGAQPLEQLQDAVAAARAGSPS